MRLLEIVGMPTVLQSPRSRWAGAGAQRERESPDRGVRLNRQLRSLSGRLRSVVPFQNVTIPE